MLLSSNPERLMSSTPWPPIMDGETESRLRMVVS